MDHALANRFIYAAVAFGLLGMMGGIYMAMSHDHTAAPAHAHLLLLGWVTMAIFGFFYWLVPSAVGILARVQWWLMVLAVPVMTLGIVLIRYGEIGLGEPLAALSSLVVLTAMVLFAVNVVRGRCSASDAPEVRMQPAE